jgi:PAS domain S-box-containing protein
MYRIFGLNPQEYVNYNKFLSYVNPEDRDYVYNSTKEAFNGKIYATDYRIVRPDGEERIVHSEREVIFDEKNSSVRVRGTAQDVTEHENAQEALRASEAQYRSLYESSLDGILLTKPDGTILSANSQACSLFNMTEDEIIQAGRGDIVNKDERLAAMLEERKLTGKAMAELTFKRKDRSTFVGETSSSLFKDADGSIKTSITIRDITKRKRAEEALRDSEARFKAYLENSAVIAWMKDDEGRHTFMSSNCEKRFGVRFED